MVVERKNHKSQGVTCVCLCKAQVVADHKLKYIKSHSIFYALK